MSDTFTGFVTPNEFRIAVNPTDILRNQLYVGGISFKIRTVGWIAYRYVYWLGGSIRVSR